MQALKTLPDIAKTKPGDRSLPLQWVGMEEISIPLTLDAGDGKRQTLIAKADAYVSLDSQSAKGIHMSRLHTLLNQLEQQECNRDTLDQLLCNMVQSQAETSHNAKVKLKFDFLLTKPSLLSNKKGFQSYPVELTSQRVQQKSTYTLNITIPYSSTCPCSAALSRQLLAEKLDRQFTSASIDKEELLAWTHKTSVATPHSQRSYAYLKLSLDDQPWPALASLIRQIEGEIGTPVQTMVKRTDEQEFARLNAENLMFCEDAARKIKAMLERSAWVKDYWFKVEHQESLHAHNAVVIDQKYPER